MNAPEQIIKRIPTKGKPFYTIPVEYVRADLYATQAARIAELEGFISRQYPGFCVDEAMALHDAAISTTPSNAMKEKE